MYECVSKNEHAFFIRHAKAYDNSYMYTHVSKSLFINTHTRALKNLSSLHDNLANVSSLEILGCLSVHFFLEVVLAFVVVFKCDNTASGEGGTKVGIQQNNITLKIQLRL